MTLPAMLLRLTHKLFPYFFTSKKWRKIWTEGGWPKHPHKMPNALTKAQLLGCRWAGAMLISVSSSRLNPEKGKRIPMRLNTVW